MAFDYSGLLSTANRLISEFGKSATLIKPGTATGPDYDPQPGTPVESSITLVEVDWTQMYRSETLVQTGDRFWLVSAAGDSPKLEDKISVDGTEHQLVNIKPLKPGPTLMMFTVHGRGTGRVSSSVLLLEVGTDRLLLEGTTNSISLEGNL